MIPLEIFESIFSFLPTNEELFKLLKYVKNLNKIVKVLVFEGSDIRNYRFTLDIREGELFVNYLKKFPNITKIIIKEKIYFNKNDIKKIFKNNIFLKEVYYFKLDNEEIINSISQHSIIYTEVYSTPDKKIKLLNKNHKFRIEDIDKQTIDSIIENICDKKIDLNIIRDDKKLMNELYNNIAYIDNPSFFEQMSNIPDYCVGVLFNRIYEHLYMYTSHKIEYLVKSKFDMISFFNNKKNVDIVVNVSNSFLYYCEYMKTFISKKIFDEHEHVITINATKAIPLLSFFKILNNKIDYRTALNSLVFDNIIYNFNYVHLNEKYKYFYSNFTIYVKYLIDIGYDINRIDKETRYLLNL